jgi:hypothetical protein
MDQSPSIAAHSLTCCEVWVEISVNPVHYKKPVNLWRFSRDVLWKHHGLYLSVMLIIFLSRISKLDTRPIILWRFPRFITNRPMILWRFSHSSQINSPFVTFYKIRHEYRTNSPISMDPHIVLCWRGMNISYWSDMSDLHKKLFLLPKYNITSPLWPTWHIGI